jgi:hypothetical protein
MRTLDTPRIFAGMATSTKTTVRPEWGDARTVHAHFNLGKSTLYRAHAEGKIRAVSMRERGKLRGKKLWNLCSIESWILSMEEAP